MRFSLKLLGGALLEGADGPVRGRAAHKRRLALLAALAAARGRPVPRERLASLLWPASSTQAGRHSLSESLSVLRRELAEDVFVCVGDDIALNLDRVRCDLIDFEAALEEKDPVEAVARYGGAFLDGFYVSEAPEFERWAEGERDRVGRVYAKALETLAEESEAGADLLGAAEWWRRLAVYDPYSSRVALRLMQALDAAGEREAALRHAAVHAAFLREELETDPAADLQAFVERLRREPVVPAQVSPKVSGDREPLPASARPERGSGVDDAPADGSAGAASAAPEAAVEADARQDVRALEEGAPAAPPASPGAAGDDTAQRTAAVWFADIVGYSELLARDPHGAAAVLDILQGAARGEVRHGHGHIVEFIGDGVLAEFPEAAACARAAVRLVRAFERRTREAGVPATLQVGVHVGTVDTTSDGGIYGGAVTVATRLERRAAPGQVIVSGDVRARLRVDADFRFSGRGVATIPGEAAPVSVYDLQVETRTRPPARGAPPRVRELPAPPRGKVGWRAAALAAAVVLALCVGVFVYRSGSPPPAEAGDGRLPPNRIAILYFSSNSVDPDQRALAKGLTDQLIHELAQVEVLDVVPPSGVRLYRDSAVPLDSVAAALRAGTLLDGSLERAGERLKLTLYLIDASSGERLRSTVLHARAGDLFELEEQLAREAARFLRWRLGRRLEVRTHSSGTRSVRARELVLLAEQAREDAQAMVREGDSLKVAVGRRLYAYTDDLLKRAEAADPRWAEPPGLRGWVALERGSHSPPAEEEQLVGQALAHAERALRLRPEDPRALELRGSIRWRLSFMHPLQDSAESLLVQAQRDLQAAVDADPQRASAWSMLSQIRRVLGDHEGSYFAADRAFKADAYLLKADQVRSRLFRSALSSGRLDLAAEQCTLGASEFPGNWRFVECRLVLLAWADTGRADAAAAADALRAINKTDPPGVARSDGRAYMPVYRQMLYAAVLARAGQHDSARAIVDRARAEVGTSREARASFAYDEAHVRVQLGDRAGAARAVRTLLDLQPLMRGSVATDYPFRSLRSDPAFRAAVRPE